MHQSRRRMMALAMAAGLAVAWGCGDGKPSVDTSTTEATVSGKVTIKGKPATKGTVVFDPSNYQRKSEAPRTAEIGPDGSYKVTTLVGANQIVVNSPQLKETDYSPIQFDAQAGKNTFDVALPPAQ